MEYNSARAKNKLLSHAIMWVNVTDVILRKKVDTKVIHSIIPFIATLRTGKSTPLG